MAEQLFTYQAVKNGFLVSRPLGHASSYDFILDRSNRLFRVQVKSNFCGKYKQRTGYRITVRKGGSSKVELYEPDSIDFFALYISEINGFYNIPFHLIETHVVTVYPGKETCRFFNYLNNWDLNHGAKDKTSPS